MAGGGTGCLRDTYAQARLVRLSTLELLRQAEQELNDGDKAAPKTLGRLRRQLLKQGDIEGLEELLELAQRLDDRGAFSPIRSGRTSVFPQSPAARETQRPPSGAARCLRRAGRCTLRRSNRRRADLPIAFRDRVERTRMARDVHLHRLCRRGARGWCGNRGLASIRTSKELTPVTPKRCLTRSHCRR